MKLNNYLSKFFDVEENEVENDEGEKIPSLLCGSMRKGKTLNQ
ncbi:hypothetical protein ACGE9R_004766 [Enterobacter hormaechei]|nr:hypothetical protein [Serratia nevei]BEO02208.1 hypothetical protein SMQC11_54960 [Serratia marcescens]